MSTHPERDYLFQKSQYQIIIQPRHYTQAGNCRIFTAYPTPPGPCISYLLSFSTHMTPPESDSFFRKWFSTLEGSYVYRNAMQIRSSTPAGSYVYRKVNTRQLSEPGTFSALIFL